MSETIISMCRRTWNKERRMCVRIISMCRRTWNRERCNAIISIIRRTWNKESRICVLLRTIERPLSVFDCIPEQVFDAQLKDAFEYLPDQREYILHYAIPGSSVVRSIRRLDGYRATPLALKSLHFPEDESLYAYEFRKHLPTTPVLLARDAGEDRVVSPRRRPHLPESEGSAEIQTPNHNDASILKDACEFGEQYTSTPDSSEFYGDEDRAISREWSPLPEAEKIEMQITNHDDASTIEDAYEIGQEYTSTPDSSEFYAAEDGARSREWSPLPDSAFSEIQTPSHDGASILEDACEVGQVFSSNFDAAEFYREWTSVPEFDEDSEIQTQNHDAAEFYREWTSVPEFDKYSEIQIRIHDDASTLEDAYEIGQEFTSTPDSSEFYAAEGGARSREWSPSSESEDIEIQIPIHDDASTLEDAYENEQAFTSTPDSSEFYAAEDGARSREWSPLPESADSEIQTPIHDGASILEDACEVGQVFSSNFDAADFYREWTSVPEYDDSEVRALIHDDASTMEDAYEIGQQFTSTLDSSEFYAAEDGAIPREVSPLPESEGGEIQTPIHDGASVLEDLPCGDPEQLIEYSESGDVENCATPQESASEEVDESLEGDSPEPRRLFPINQPAFCTPPQTGLQTTTLCPAPLRRFLTPEGIKQFDAFEDWYVRTYGGVYPDEENEKYTSLASSPGPGNDIFSLGEIFPFPENEFGERDDISEADSPGPRQLFPVHQSHPAEYDPPQLAPHMGIHCPIPIRKHATHEVILRPGLFDDWFVDMRELVFIDEAISPDKSDE